MPIAFIGEAEDGDIMTFEPLPQDWGFYTQVFYGFQWGWEAGLR